MYSNFFQIMVEGGIMGIFRRLVDCVKRLKQSPFYLGVTLLFFFWAVVFVLCFHLIQPEISCFSGDYLRNQEQLICKPGKSRTIKIERAFPEDIKIYRMNKITLPEVYHTQKSASFHAKTEKGYSRYSCSVLEGSEINYTCRGESNASWYLFNYSNMQNYLKGEIYTPIRAEKGKGHFQGNYVVSEPGEYDIVAEGHNEEGMMVDFDISTTYALYNLTGLQADTTCAKKSCVYDNVSEDDVFVLSNTGDMNEVKVYYSGETNGVILVILIIIALLLLIVAIMGFCGFFSVNKKRD